MVFDGIPRNLEQKVIFDEVVKDYCVMCLDLEKDMAIERLTHRRVCPLTGKVFGPDHTLDHNPENGAKLVTRTDDTVDAITQRMELFYENTLPLLDTWKQEGRQVYHVDASRDIDTVFSDVLAIVKTHV